MDVFFIVGGRAGVRHGGRRGEGRRQKAEGQKAEGRSAKSELRSQRTESPHLLLAIFCLLLLSLLSGPAGTFTVISTADSGAGTLRDAITQANAQANGALLDQIQFAIPGTGVQSIQLSSPLPTIVDPVIIDGTTQTGYAGTPLIELNGAIAGSSANGLYIQTSNCTIGGLTINRFKGSGIRVENGISNIIQGNFIGTGPQGTTSLGNGDAGIFIYHGSGNRIGGTNFGERNLISGNIQAGVYIYDNSSENALIGNNIGTTISGLAALGNQTNGVVIDQAPGNVVGGESPAARNIISGNGQSGIFIYGQSSSGNIISGNYIGTDISGSLAISNSVDGVTIYSATNNLIGGTNSGSGNVISGNGQRGITISGPVARDNAVQGNLIGTDASGRLALGNNFSGVTLNKASSNLIGGRIAAARNVISGNRQSGLVIGTNSFGNRVEGNFVGVDGTGANRLANAFNGIALQDSIGNFIGATASGGRNIISGNNQNGIFITGIASNNSVQGNFIGTDVSGTLAAQNAQAGVWGESPWNIIGGVGPLPCNVISGNGTNGGIFLVNSKARGNQVSGNYIGVDVTGTKKLSNQDAGVGISGAPENIIGGADGASGNVISGNGDAGIFVVGSSATGNQILGNRLGTDATGNSAFANNYEGIYLDGASSTIIGGSISGSGNQISGNSTRGIFMTNASWNTIQGNLVGTKADGLSDLGNTLHAIELEARANNNTIGPDNRVGFSKTAFGNGYAGIRVRDGSTNNFIHGNAIFSNAALGIDLGPAGVTANDGCDADTGGNMRQNFPVLTNVYSGTETILRGSLNSVANRAYLLQFYANSACDSSGNGEGQTFLGEATVSTGGNCNGGFSVRMPVGVPAGQFITATATDPFNNTSEFSACVAVMATPGLVIASSGGGGNGGFALSWTNMTGFVLYQTDNLNDPIQWTVVTNAPVLSNGCWSVGLTATNGAKFFRLMGP